MLFFISITLTTPSCSVFHFPRVTALRRWNDAIRPTSAARRSLSTSSHTSSRRTATPNDGQWSLAGRYKIIAAHCIYAHASCEPLFRSAAASHPVLSLLQAMRYVIAITSHVSELESYDPRQFFQTFNGATMSKIFCCAPLRIQHAVKHKVQWTIQHMSAIPEFNKLADDSLCIVRYFVRLKNSLTFLFSAAVRALKIAKPWAMAYSWPGP